MNRTSQSVTHLFNSGITVRDVYFCLILTPFSSFTVQAKCRLAFHIEIVWLISVLGFIFVFTLVLYLLCCWFHCFLLFLIPRVVIYCFFYAPPTIVEGHYVFWSVRPSVLPFVRPFVRSFVQVKVFGQGSFWWSWSPIDFKLSIHVPYDMIFLILMPN